MPNPMVQKLEEIRVLLDAKLTQTNNLLQQVNNVLGEIRDGAFTRELIHLDLDQEHTIPGNFVVEDLFVTNKLNTGAVIGFEGGVKPAPFTVVAAARETTRGVGSFDVEGGFTISSAAPVGGKLSLHFTKRT